MHDLKKRIDGYLAPVAGSQGYVVRDLLARREIACHQYDRFNAASIIKLSYLYTALRQVQAGIHSLEGLFTLRAEDVVGGDGVLKLMHEGLQLTLGDLLNLMIVVSDNTATNILFDILGKEAINRELAEIGIDDTLVARKLMKVVPGLTNYTSPHDAALLMEHLYEGDRLDEAYRRLALDILLKQQINNKLSANLYLCPSCGGLMAEDHHCRVCGKRAMEPQPVWFAHKTGELSTACHDVGLMHVKDHWVVVALMMAGVTDRQEALKAHGLIGKAVYEHFAR